MNGRKSVKNTDLLGLAAFARLNFYAIRHS